MNWKWIKGIRLGDLQGIDPVVAETFQQKAISKNLTMVPEEKPEGSPMPAPSEDNECLWCDFFIFFLLVTHCQNIYYDYEGNTASVAKNKT